MENIHKDIIDKLDFFIENKKIPNIMFYGPSGSGKKTLVNQFIQKIYKKNTESIKKNVMSVNCANGKGIKFIRDELKHFAKTNIHPNEFKSILLITADKLTYDAQSALRRCIELYNHTTRFFIIVRNKEKLIKPFLSRFCDIYIYYPIINNEIINLHDYYKNEFYKRTGVNEYFQMHLDELFKLTPEEINIMEEIEKKSKIFYQDSYNANELFMFLEKNNSLFNYKSILIIQMMKMEIRNEIIMMNIILWFFYLDYHKILSNEKMNNYLEFII